MIFSTVLSLAFISAAALQIAESHEPWLNDDAYDRGFHPLQIHNAFCKCITVATDSVSAQLSSAGDAPATSPPQHFSQLAPSRLLPSPQISCRSRSLP